MTDSAKELRIMVKDFLDRQGISHRRFSESAVSNPRFVFEFLDGRMPRLETADRLLVEMDLPPVGPRFQLEVEKYLEITGANRSSVGQNALNDPSFVTRFLNGSSPQLNSVDKVRAWMRESTSEEEWRKIEAAVNAELPSSQEAGGGLLARLRAMPFHLKAKELAAALHVSERTLRRWRGSGVGPKFHKLFGCVRYARTNVEVWLGSRERSSTSDPGKALPDTDETPCSPERE